MNKNLAIALSIVLGVSLQACARHVVLDPDAARQMNSTDWTVKSEPRTPVAVVAPALPAQALTADEAPKANAIKDKKKTKKAKVKKVTKPEDSAAAAQ
jgi:hypothetical protein